MTEQPKSERRRFGMHANLLYDVITKQAGTLQKAILEGVMNGVDAGASQIDINLAENHLSISDDGRGFKDRSEIDEFFEKFGTPHVEGDARFGRFRMGRGQLFSYGKNVWRTNVFRMKVDVKHDGLDYDLEILDTPAKGCSIEIDLYQTLLPSELDSIVRDLRSWVAYVPVPVVLNGKTISQDPAGMKWDVETDDAYFKLSPSKSTLAVYNLGVLVNNMPAHRFGVGGTVVSKARLDVNFARNDVQSSCPVFRAIQKELRKHSDKAVRKAKMTDVERQNIAERVIDKSLPFGQALDLKLITDVEGKHLPLDSLTKMLWATPNLVVADRGDRVAIAVKDQKLANAIARETLERFSLDTLTELLAALRASAQAAHDQNVRVYGHCREWRILHFIQAIDRANLGELDDYRHLVDSGHQGIPEKKLDRNQLVLLRAVQKGHWPIATALQQSGRTIQAGRSQVADAWTDGTRHIWINVEKLQLLKDGFSGCIRIASLLLHEYLHEGPDTDTHTHDADFYQRHHDLTIDSDILGTAATYMMRYLAYDARKREKAPGRRVALFEDAEARFVQQGGHVAPKIDFEADPVDSSDAIDETAGTAAAA